MWFKLLLTVFIGGFFRFYKLDWGEGYFFHPDEYHIAAAVERLSFPNQMNPHFFSYGSFIVYLIYFTKLILGAFIPKFLTLNPILIGRFYSAFFSTLTIILVYLISNKLFSVRSSVFAALLCAIMPGLIQQAHFATPESILTFWLFLTLYLWFKYGEQKKLRFLCFSAISLGLALGTKVVALTFLPILVMVPLINHRLELLKRPLRLIKLLVLPLLIVVITFLLVFPYSVLDRQDFRSSMNYETGVGQGRLVVFYTRQFINTIPIIFQIRKILPYTLGPGILILGALGFLGILRECLKKRKLLLVILAFLCYFLPNVFLFAKWTRFIAPSLPFFAIFASFFFSKIAKNKPLFAICYLLFAINFFWSLMFFSLYFRPDVRITATSWINQNFPSDSFIFTEAGNMLEAPLQGNCQKRSFDFYHLDENIEIQRQLPGFLEQADYFVVQSRRIFINHQRFPKQFPRIARFYDLLFSGELGFEKIKDFNSFPKLAVGSWQLAVDDELAEETWSVFDHPVIRIYKKIHPFSKETYESLLQI